MPDNPDEKCSFKQEGYAQFLCDPLRRSLNYNGSRAGGLIAQSIGKWQNGKQEFNWLGERVLLKSGEFKKKGIMLSFCPFCKGQLFDFDHVKGVGDK